MSLDEAESAYQRVKPPAARLSAMDVARQILADDLTRSAAALTYYAVLALLPALLVISTLLGVLGLSPDAVDEVLKAGAELGPRWSVELMSDAAGAVLDASASGVVFGLSVVFLLWTASGYVAAFMWAAGRINGLPEDQAWWHLIVRRLGLALLLLAFITAATAVVVLAGPVATWLGTVLGLGDGFLRAWSILRWPFLAGSAVLVFWILYRYAPARRRPSGPHLLTGVAVGVALMFVASVAFSLYVSHFASYNRVYGALAAGIVFLVWCWLLNLSLLAGVEVSALLERRTRSAARDIPIWRRG